MPYIVRQCIEEVEKRGIEEVGIYRISGVATDIQALKAVFDASECTETPPVPCPASPGSGNCTARVPQEGSGGEEEGKANAQSSQPCLCLGVSELPPCLAGSWGTLDSGQRCKWICKLFRVPLPGQAGTAWLFPAPAWLNGAVDPVTLG